MRPETPPLCEIITEYPLPIFDNICEPIHYYIKFRPVQGSLTINRSMDWETKGNRKKFYMLEPDIIKIEIKKPEEKIFSEKEKSKDASNYMNQVIKKISMLRPVIEDAEDKYDKLCRIKRKDKMFVDAQKILPQFRVIIQEVKNFEIEYNRDHTNDSVLSRRRAHKVDLAYILLEIENIFGF